MITVLDILGLEGVQTGAPVVLAGGRNLSRTVRWVHVAEIPDIARLLQGGELILTTGVQIPGTEDGQLSYARSLHEAGATGVVIELGTAHSELHPGTVRWAEEQGFPLIALHRETQFVAITEQAHAAILSSQVDELRACREIQNAFSEHAIEGAAPAAIVRDVHRLTGCDAVLEDAGGHILFVAGDRPTGEIVNEWERARLALTHPPRTARTGSGPVWLGTLVGARGNDWGRIALRVESGTPSLRHDTALEQAASALALNRLVQRDRETLERQAHRLLMSAIEEQTVPFGELLRRAERLGVPLTGDRFVAMHVIVPVTGTPDAHGHAVVHDVAEHIATALRRLRAPALISSHTDTSILMLVPLLSTEEEAQTIDAIADAIHDIRSQERLTIGASTPFSSIADAVAGLREAEQVALAARRRGRWQPVHRLADVPLHGLLQLIGTDARMQVFVEEQLRPFRESKDGPELLRAVEGYIRCAGNKSQLAEELHLSRPALYKRLTDIEELLHASLSDSETLTALHLAILADQLVNASG